MEINVEMVHRVLSHYLESHGLCFQACISGLQVPKMEIPPNTKLVDFSYDGKWCLTFWAAVSGTMFLFEVRKATLLSFIEWAEAAFANLGKEYCRAYATLPTSVIIDGGVSEYVAKEKKLLKV